MAHGGLSSFYCSVGVAEVLEMVLAAVMTAAETVVAATHVQHRQM
jgi:hypothetical protein